MLARTKEAFIQEANDLADSNKRSAAAIQKKLSDLELENVQVGFVSSRGEPRA
jgi:hypothetical protein